MNAADITSVNISGTDNSGNFSGILNNDRASIKGAYSLQLTQNTDDPESSSTVGSDFSCNFDVNDITIEAEGYGVVAQGNYNHKLTAAELIDITSKNDDAVFASLTGAKIELNGKDIKIQSLAGGNAVKTGTSGIISIVADDTLTLKANERGAVAVTDPGKVSLKAKTINIEATINNEKTNEPNEYGLRYANALSVEDTSPLNPSISGESELILSADEINISVTDTRHHESFSVNAIASSEGNNKLVIDALRVNVNGNIKTEGSFDLTGTLSFNGENAYIANLTGNSKINLFNKDQKLNVTNNGKLTIAGTGDLNDGYSGDLEKFYNNQLDGTKSGQGEGVTTKVLLNEGFYNGEAYGLLDEDGKFTKIVSKGASQLMYDTLDIASGSTVMLNRILMNDVHKRLGDLRNNAGMNGAWVRYDGGRLSGGHVANKFNTIQLGADMPFADNFHAGVSASYTRGDVDFTRGGAGMDAYSFAAYGTWFAPNGMYADVVARYGYVKNELTVNHSVKGDLDNNALALSGEFGWKFDVAKDFFVTPQVEASYMHIDSDKVNFSNKKSYKFDSVDSFIGRAGLAAGYTFPNQKGNVFVKASAVHEFAGDSKVTGANGTSLKKDGKDTWAEFGVGAQYNFNKNVQAWANLERTAGADIEEDYRATVGVRINF